MIMFDPLYISENELHNEYGERCEIIHEIH